MLFPVCAHTEDGVSYSITIPDIPGCFTAGDTLSEALANIREAVECHLAGDDLHPKPGPLEKYVNDPLYEGGIWLLADIDVAGTGVVSVNVNLPENILRAIDEESCRLGLSRSAFLTEAARIRLGVYGA